MSNLPNYKPRFKAIEGFLRRVAYNLGNSPSQTEVKIISCIPIDVTDLQQKILQLEQELKEAKQGKDTPNNQNSIIHTAICNNILCPTCSAKYDQDRDAGVSERCCLDSTSIISIRHPESSAQPLRSNFSFVCPSAALNQDCPFAQRQPITTNTERSKTKNLFSRKKKPKKKKDTTRFIYCAQTNVNTPFQTSFSFSDDLTSKNFKEANASNNDAPLSSSYLADMVEKQYKPQRIFNLSDISSPVCRDNMSNFSQSLPIESDICSCCHGQFHNIDDHINHRNIYNVYPTCESLENSNRNAYYDSKFYDLVPVKENLVKKNPINEIQKRKDPQRPSIKCWPEKVRTKYRAPPNVVNYCTVSAVRDHNVKRFPAKLQNRKDIVVNKMAAKRIKVNPLIRPRKVIDPPELSSVDYSPVYSKRPKKLKKQRVFLTEAKKRNVATCMPTTNNNADCQTASIAVDIPLGDAPATAPGMPLPENKTETTLNQIKSILQSVLIEVKETKLVKPPELPKKDAVVGPSQGNVFGGSQFLQSYTYSPYNINPSLNPYIPSCSHQTLPSNYTYTGLQERCMQQFPLIVQPQKHICTNCYRNSNIGKTNTKYAASAATNTEFARPQGHSTETEQLIKEIYKSMAMNIDMPSSKDNTIGDYTKLNSLKDSTNTVKTATDKDSKHIAKAISEIFRNPKPPETTDTRDTDETIPSKLASSNKATVGSENISKKYRNLNYSQHFTSTTESIDRETEQISRNLETEEQSDSTVVNEDTAQSSTETESDDLIVNIKEPIKEMDSKKGKDGIFKKMLKIFQPKQRRRKEEQDDQNDSESDSDDYQTVYSHKTAAPAPRKLNLRSRPHSKVFYSKQLQQRRSRTKSPAKRPHVSPYMEQEYRRYWDEKLMFHDPQSRRHSTEVSRQNIDTPRMRRPAYYQTYEARNVLVDPIRQVPLRMPGNVLKQEHLTNNSPRYSDNYSGNRTNYPGNKINYERTIPHQKQQVQCAGKSGYTGNKPHFIAAKSNVQRKNILPGKGLAWLKNGRLGIQCGPQWKELILNG